MHIIVIGAGAVGSYLAERLSLEGQDVVVVEADGSRAEEVQSEVDCLVIHGNGASTSALEEAGIQDAGLLIAVTSSDAVNVLACQAAARYHVPRRVARVEDPTLREQLGELGVDVVIDPGETLAHELVRLVGRGRVSEMIEFADGRLLLIGGYVARDAPLAGLSLAELRTRVSGWEWLVAAVIRDGETMIARGDTLIEAGDHVLVMSKGDHAGEALGLMGLEAQPPRKVIILGATRLAVLAAEQFAGRHLQTILIDEDADRCRDLAAEWDRVVVVQGDPTDPKVLQSEGVESADAVLALTGWDEVNIVGCLIAKALGAETTIARFHRFEYVGLLPGIGIDAGVSSRLAAANAILRFVRRGHVHSVVTFQDSAAEAIELELDPGSRVIGQTIQDIGLPKSVIVGGVVRDGEAFVPHGSTVISAKDRLIVVALPEAISSVESIFG
jgi:trk system potassium uptake protein TrkA